MTVKITIAISNERLTHLQPIYQQSDIDEVIDTTRQLAHSLLDKELTQASYNKRYQLSEDDIVSDFNGDFLYLAMCIREVYNDDLVPFVGIEDDDIELLDIGVCKPSHEQLKWLANALQFPVGFFTREGDVNRDGEGMFMCTMPAWAG